MNDEKEHREWYEAFGINWTILLLLALGFVFWYFIVDTLLQHWGLIKP